ncbi:SMI1/KNR4 family protein [Brenneria tiliae]|uniref:SMI1/KNR4 family protein n=1 Tax=Brenneria tiliae TaxID=2914984 RepID=A0ABT0MQC7_9GAMM|nr:SMI1/KNR4 family protein [Brenneria tiliae]MCL2892050.1 SMI1/KNR4 family protein [Brenneria tiliae]
MSVGIEDLVKWETDESQLIVDDALVRSRIKKIELELNVSLPEEYCNYIISIADQAAGTKDGSDYFLVKYNDRISVALMSVLFDSDCVIKYTKLLQESIYDHRSLLKNGMIAIGCDYDDDGDAYVIYDVRPNSPTYQHVFHWRYYVDNLVVGEGLGFIAHSLKEFLSMPTSEDEL